jgi:hypothetical protein
LVIDLQQGLWNNCSGWFIGTKKPNIEDHIMLLSHVYRKFAGKDSASLQEDSLPLPEKFRRGRAAAEEILPLLKTKLAAPDGRLHAGTMLSAAAWLTGTSLYLSFHCGEEDGSDTILKSEEVNREWERLVYLLEEYNFQKADIPVGRLVLAAMAAPPFFKPQTAMPDVQSELQEPYNAVMRKHGFDDREGARVGIILCSILIQQYSGAGIIDADAAAGIVAQRIFEAASAAPPP